MIALLTVLTWNGLASAGAAFGMTMATLGRWQKDTFKLRWFFVLCSMGGRLITPSSARHSVWLQTPCASSVISGVCVTSLSLRRLRHQESANMPVLPGLAASA